MLYTDNDYAVTVKTFFLYKQSTTKMKRYIACIFSLLSNVSLAFTLYYAFFFPFSLGSFAKRKVPIYKETVQVIRGLDEVTGSTRRLRRRRKTKASLEKHVFFSIRRPRTLLNSSKWYLPGVWWVSKKWIPIFSSYSTEGTGQGLIRFVGVSYENKYAYFRVSFIYACYPHF